MSRFNTGNPLGSLQEEDFYDNSMALDEAMNSTNPTFVDRFGVEKPTIDAALKSAGFMPAGFDFVTGGTLQPGDRNKAVYNPAPNGDNNWYRWNGAFPKEIAANSQPNPKDENNWVPVIIKTGVVEREALRRTYQEVGLVLVPGSFEQGAVISSTTDVVLHEKTGKCYSGPIGVVPKGTNPVHPVGNWKLVSDLYIPLTFNYFEKYGAVGDGVTDNTQAFLLAKAELGLNKICRLSEGKTYYFAGSRPDLTGLAIFAEYGATIKTDANPNIKNMTLINDVTINNTVHQTTIIKHGNFSHDFLVAAGGVINSHGIDKKLIKKSFTDPDVGVGALASGQRDFTGPFTGKLVDRKVSWTNSFATGEQGVYFTGVEEGVLYEVSVKHDGVGTFNPSSFRSIGLITNTERNQLSVFPGDAAAKVFNVTSTETTVVASIRTPNGGAYSLASNGSVVLGIRLVAGVVEYYINGTIIYKYVYNGIPSKIAFLTSYVESEKTIISMPVKTYIRQPRSSSPIKLAVIGDSISYGAWSSTTYDEIMSIALSMSGLGEVSSINYGVSGSSSSNWIPGGSIDITTKDLTDVDYALVMLGTNDVQGGVGIDVFETNIRKIINHIRTSNVVPVLGVFPVWTSKTVSGSGVTTTNYAMGGEHRQVIKMLAAELSIPLADVCSYIGTDLSLYGDNIHPTELGQIRVAGAFAEAIIGDKGPGVSNYRQPPENFQLALINSWSSIVGSQTPSVHVDYDKKSVRLLGPITGGGKNTIISTLPVKLRPEFKVSFCVPCNSNTSESGFAQISIFPSGGIELTGASVNPYVVWLDGVEFQTK